HAIAMPGVCPSIIEHIFTPGMCVQVKGQGGGQCAVSIQQQVLSVPAGGGRCASCCFEAVQPGMLQARVSASQCVPLVGVDVRQRVCNNEAVRRVGQRDDVRHPC